LGEITIDQSIKFLDLLRKFNLCALSRFAFILRNYFRYEYHVGKYHQERRNFNRFQHPLCQSHGRIGRLLDAHGDFSKRNKNRKLHISYWLGNGCLP